MRVAVTETVHELRLAGGPLRYTLRRTSRARTLRVTIHPDRGVIVSLPPPSRRGWTHADAHVERFLAAREGWIRRHLGRQAAERDARATRPPLGAGRSILFRGMSHVVRFVDGHERARRSDVVRADPLTGAELRVELARRDGRSPVAILEAWLRDQARLAIDAAIDRHAAAMGVVPRAVTLRDPRSRWGSCSRDGRISLSWRLILAPPEALESVVVHELCHLRVFGHGPRFRALFGSRMPDHQAWRRWLHVHGPELHAALEASGEASAAA